MAKKHLNLSTQKLTYQWELVDIPGLEPCDQTVWQIKCLALKGPDGEIRHLVLPKLLEWFTNEKEDYNKLLRAMRYAGSRYRHTDDRIIRPDSKKSGAYEFKGKRSKCRLFFFYYEAEKKIIICTGTCWKGKGFKKSQQSQGFAKCAKFKDNFNK